MEEQSQSTTNQCPQVSIVVESDDYHDDSDPDDSPTPQFGGSISGLDCTRDHSALKITPTNPPPFLRGQTFGYVRTVKRRGRSYVVQDSLPSEENPAEANGVDTMISDLYHETLQMASSTHSQSNRFRYFCVASDILIVMFGVIIGSLTLQSNASDIQIYIAGILGLISAGLKGIMSTFKIQNRSVDLKRISLELRAISRKLRNLQSSDMTTIEKGKKLEEFYTEVDQLDLSIFDHTMTRTPPPNSIITPVKPSRSDLSSDIEPVSEVEVNPTAMNFINLLRRKDRTNPEGAVHTEV